MGPDSKPDEEPDTKRMISSSVLLMPNSELSVAMLKLSLVELSHPFDWSNGSIFRLQLSLRPVNRDLSVEPWMSDSATTESHKRPFTHSKAGLIIGVNN